MGLLGIGVWAWVQKEMFKNIGKLTTFFVDPGLIFIIVGAVIFIIGFAGCVGALRENTCLLMFVSTNDSSIRDYLTALYNTHYLFHY